MFGLHVCLYTTCAPACPETRVTGGCELPCERGIWHCYFQHVLRIWMEIALPLGFRHGLLRIWLFLSGGSAICCAVFQSASLLFFFFFSVTYYFKILFSNFSVSCTSLWKTLFWHVYLKTRKGVLKGDSGTGDVSQWIWTLAMVKRKFEFKFLAPV